MSDDAVTVNIGCLDEFLRANGPPAAGRQRLRTAVQIYTGKRCHAGIIPEHQQIIKKCVGSIRGHRWM